MKCQVCHEPKGNLKRVATVTMCESCRKGLKDKGKLPDEGMGVIVGNTGRASAVRLLSTRVAAIKQRIDSGNDTKLFIKASARGYKIPAKAPTFSKLQ